MKKVNFRSDLAIESLSEAIENKDYKHSEEVEGNIKIEKFEILQRSLLYPHDCGKYIEMSFPDYQDMDIIIHHMTHQLQTFIKQSSSKVDPLILFVGLGNHMLTSDALGPRSVYQIRATHHYPLQHRHEYQYYDCQCIIPGVMASTGMESANVVECLVQEYHPDLIVVIDALCAQHYDKLCRVIQMNNVGIYPGSGIGNHRKKITKETMGVPVIAIGVPTVIHVSSLVSDVYNLLEGYFEESLHPSTALKVGKRTKYQGRLNDLQKKLILGEVGCLDENQRLSLLNEVLSPIDNQFVMSHKDIDYDIEVLSRIISSSINDLKY